MESPKNATLLPLNMDRALAPLRLPTGQLGVVAHCHLSVRQYATLCTRGRSVVVGVAMR